MTLTVIYWAGAWQDPEDWMTGMHLSGDIRDLFGYFMNVASVFYLAEIESSINKDSVLELRA